LVTTSYIASPDGTVDWLFLDADCVYTEFIARHWIDEFWLIVHPIRLGVGIPLFLPHSERTDLTLSGCHAFPSGLVQRRCRRADA
jgi:dihydrofolate reductase